MPDSTRLYSTGRAFLARAQHFLEENESLNNLVLGISLRVTQQPGWYRDRIFLATVESPGGEIRIAAVMTPPYQMVLAGSEDVDDDAIEALTEALLEQKVEPPGVNGPARLSERFAVDWSEANGLNYRVGMRQRVYELRKVNPIPRSPGRLRTANMEDLDLVVKWREAFTAESMPGAPAEDAREVAGRMIASGDTYLWEDPAPVSMCVKTRPTPHGTTVSAVYTPPELRRRGYASSIVAAVSQVILDQGKQFCTLFTDLANPTSNSIYQKIGYEPLGDFTVFRFEQPDP